MVSLDNLRHEQRAAVLDLARRHGARSIRVSGSVARGQATEQSDLDLLVEWEPERSLLDVISRF
jgi:predicted nucleotidyltransferase